MEIDAATRANLELTRTLSGERAGSLLATIDRTVTPAGARLLAERLAAPLTDTGAIAQRHASVRFFAENRDLRSDLRKRFRRAPDFMRSLSRLVTRPRRSARPRGPARGTCCCRRSEPAYSQRRHADEVARARAALQEIDHGIAKELTSALAPDLPLDRRAGNFIAAGYDSALEESRALRDESRRVIATLQARYCDVAGSAS